MGSYGVLLVAAIVVGLIAGPLIERGLLRFMYGRDEIVLVLVTYALFLILEDFTKLLFGVDPLLVAEPYSLLGNLADRPPDLPGLQPGAGGRRRSSSASRWRWCSIARARARCCAR